MVLTKKIEKYEGDYRWLSNFDPVRITYEGAIYDSIEHAYQAAKTVDMEERKRFQSGVMVAKGKNPQTGKMVVGYMTAADAKRAGRHLQVRSGWEEMKVPLMKDLKRQKYSKQPFKRLLLETGDAEIIHGVWWNDTFWGVRYGIGKNIDGRLTMDIRAELQAEIKPIDPPPDPFDEYTGAV
jgi:N-glycosidase YbiA